MKKIKFKYTENEVKFGEVDLFEDFESDFFISDDFEERKKEWFDHFKNELQNLEIID